MYMNQKLKDNIINSIVSGIVGVQGVNPESKRHISQAASNAIDSAMNETWEDMTLAERCGPPLWDYLLWMAAVADNEDKPHLYLRALTILQEGHPCKDICRPHMKSNLQLVNLKDYPTCVDHCIALHNLVNRQLGKDEFSPLRAKEKVDLGCDSCTFNPVGKSRSQQHNASKKTSNVSKGNETYIVKDSSYNNRNNSSNKNYLSNSKSIGVGSKTYTDSSTYSTDRRKTITNNRHSVVDTAIHYPSSFRVRDTNPTGVYTSRRSPTY